jgi:hypothetical protein
MKHGLLLLMWLLSASSILGQSIYTALHLNRPESVRISSGRAIIEISEENLFINSLGQEIKKTKKVLNRNFCVLLEERFDDQGKRTERLTRKFDSLEQRTTSRKFERWNNILGYSVEIASYEYDSSGYLIKMTDKTSMGQIIQQAFLTNNNRGHPLKLELYDGNGNLYGTEEATYNYLTNKALTEVKNRNGIVISSDSTTIDFLKSKDIPRQGFIFNEYGDMVSSEKYAYEYKYDDFGNWKVKMIFKIVNGKKKKDRVFKRKIKYRE